MYVEARERRIDVLHLIGFSHSILTTDCVQGGEIYHYACVGYG